MAYIESDGALNSTHSLTHLIDWGLALPAQRTEYTGQVTLELLTGIHGKGYRLQ